MGLYFDPAIPLLGNTKSQNTNSKELMHQYVQSSAIYNSQVLEAAYGPVNKLVVGKTVVYLHNGILCSRKKAAAPTLCNSMDSMDGTGDYYAK